MVSISEAKSRIVVIAKSTERLSTKEIDMVVLYAGIDLHSNNSVVVVLDENDRAIANAWPCIEYKELSKVDPIVKTIFQLI